MLKVQEIREIIKLIDESSIHEFTYETDGAKIKLKKEVVATTKQAAPVNEPVLKTKTKEVEQVQEVDVQKKEIAENIEEESEQSTVDYNHEIVSPMVGTFYQAPAPESDPYVTKNSEVASESIVCIVEAMKLFNEIEAEVSGTIVEVLVEDGELVEYGQPLFRVK